MHRRGELRTLGLHPTLRGVSGSRRCCADRWTRSPGTLGHKFTSVPGIGDECDQEDGNIFIRKGTNWVDINLVKLNDPAQNVQPMQTAAKIVAGRLP